MPEERMISKLTIDVWPTGISEHDMAEELRRIAQLLVDGYYSGEVITGDDHPGRGYWSTST